MYYDIQLTPHFKLSEFIKSSTAAALKMDLTPTLTVVSNLQYLCQHGLEPLRQHFNCPIIINSGYRSLELNKYLYKDRPNEPAATTSNHLSGFAADIRVPDNETGMKWFRWLDQNLPDFDELITERNNVGSATFWIHLAICQGGRSRRKVIQNLIKNK